MVRIICLIFVFGIASLCLAASIHAPTAYARSGHAVCPCWPGGPTELDNKLGDPADPAISPNPCDTRPIIVHKDKDQKDERIEHFATVHIFQPNDVLASAHIREFPPKTIDATNCRLSYGTENVSWRDIPFSEAQACMQDIFAWCRDYCKAHPDDDYNCSQ